MKSITLNEYHILRNNTYNMLVDKKLIIDNDENFNTFDVEFYKLFTII